MPSTAGAVEAGHRAQPARDRRPGAASCLEVASEALDISASYAAEAQGRRRHRRPPAYGTSRCARSLVNNRKYAGSTTSHPVGSTVEPRSR